MSSTATSHPNIGKITRQIEVIDSLFFALDYRGAWGAILVVMRGLKPAHKRRDDYQKLMKGILYAIKRVDSLRALNAYDAHLKKISLAQKLDKDFHSRFMSLLWDCNMLTAGAYEYYDPTGKKSSDGVDISIEGRDTTNIR